MRMFEIHELEDRITEVLHQMQETGETVSVTEGGEVHRTSRASTYSTMACSNA